MGKKENENQSGEACILKDNTKPLSLISPTKNTYSPARIDVLALRVVVMPAFAIEMVCCSITCTPNC
tara:strand:- start:599 stop:799 length:201 start_codon:yes stop_codon:yes gene_type:complete